MLTVPRITLACTMAAALCAPGAFAAPKTVCTITVNSADEKEAFAKRLPAGEYRFVELLERGRPDWLRSSCRKGIQCDVLVVSGHFNAGDTFYSDKIDISEHLDVDELERASCSESCPGLFARLKEVYLFGCESLNPDATKYSSSYGESGRDRMRRLFANVPAIYGFYSSAPVGPTAAMLLGRYFDSAPRGEIGSGRPSARLLSAFRNNHITVTSGFGASDARAAQRREVCEFYDERRGAEDKLAFIHGLLARDRATVHAYFERIEKLFAAFDDLDRQSPAFLRGLAQISQDRAARERFIGYAREAARPEMRVRMIALARALGWLTPEEQRAEQARLAGELLARGGAGFAEVDLVCAMNGERQLDGERERLGAPSARGDNAAQAAMRACLGSREARAQTLRALESADDRDVQAAQAYLRHRPLDAAELRGVAERITRMGESRAQVRALETLARQNISDRAILEELTRSFTAAKSVGVQRAIAEVFIRSDPRAIPKVELASVLRQHRLRAPGGGEDLIDVLMRRLQS